MPLCLDPTATPPHPSTSSTHCSMVLALFSAGTAAFSSPGTLAAGSHFTRTPGPSMKGQKKTRKERKVAETDEVTGMDGMVVPAQTPSPTDAAQPVYAPTDAVVADPAPASPAGSRLPPLTGTVAASVAASGKRVEWNPNGLDVSQLPEPLKAQFFPAYLKTSPSYLDGSLPGDIGFDPWGLVALANPSQATDAFARTAKERDAQMLSMAPEQQQEKLAWMQESELKHGRLAPLSKTRPTRGSASPSPEDALGCPIPRSASGNQPRVPRWPAVSCLFSPQAGDACRRGMAHGGALQRRLPAR